MNAKDEQFFSELRGRITSARKQQTLAQYEGGRSRLPVSMLPALAESLTLSFDELMGHPVVRQRDKRGAMSRLQQPIAVNEELPKPKQQFVSQMLETALA